MAHTRLMEAGALYLSGAEECRLNPQEGGSRPSSSIMTASRGAISPSSVPQPEATGSRSWYERLQIADDLMEDSPRGSPEHSTHVLSDISPEPTDAGSDIMKPEPTIVESQQNLREAMEQLRTRSRSASVVIDSHMLSEERDPTTRSASPSQVEPEASQRSNGHDHDPILRYKELLQRIQELSSGLSNVNDTLLEKFSSVLNRLEKLERAHEEQSQNFQSSKQSKPRRKTYITPRRRAESVKTLARGVRDEIDALLNSHDESPFVSDQDSNIFVERVKSDPHARCCTVSDFQIDVNGGSASVWNQSAALVFTEHYLAKRKLGAEDAEKVRVAFLTRVKTIKQSFRETPKQKAKKGGYVRKYNLFQRRVEALATLPALQEHLPLLQRLSIDGMSSDEEEDDNVQSGIARAATVKNPNYRVLTPVWRSKELTMFLHVLDSVYLIKRRLENQRGNWPRPRVYDPNSPKLSQKTTFPKNLPVNAYDEGWLKKFPNARLSVNPTSPYNFVHSPAVFHYLLTPVTASALNL
ncbi:hypothetical protein NMY22_g7765 [Coprinellus aureogranulatus]|nr:hypothetical protein NMY22_g7765 [Coprinellus aureogranulatus]